MTSTLTMTIAGKAADGQETFPVVNPATGEQFARAPECSPAQLDAAVRAGQQAFPAWSNDENARRDTLRAAAKRIEESVDEIAPVLTGEQGKPLAEARGEVLATSTGLRYVAEMALPRERAQDDDDALVDVTYRPFGVVAAITPWNYPVAISGLKMGPALLAGNCVVLKPSPFTPVATLYLGELLRDILPAGVLSIVSGSDSLGALLAEHRDIRKITFTGSVATGQKVAAAAAPDLKRLTLELGGNDAAILLDDFDVDAFADRLFWSVFTNCGQVCAAIKRVYAPDRLYERVVDALADRAHSVRIGDGAADGTELGPVSNQTQWLRIDGLVTDALRHGGRAARGGGPIDRAGYFFTPTILTGVEDGVRVVDEEQFGPVVPVIPYREVDNALARANDTHFGLDGSVWSADLDRASDVAARFECGTAWVNTHMVPDPAVPFGGHKWSGLGVEGGTAGLLNYTNPQVLHRARR